MGINSSYARFLRGDLETANKAEAIKSWRDKIPFTNDEIAQALESLASEMPDFLRLKYQNTAKSVRGGFLNGRIMGMAVPALVKLCAICGATALYRQGYSGRCKAHRHILDMYVIEQRARYSARAEDIRRMENIQRIKEAHARSAHASRKFR